MGRLGWTLCIGYNLAVFTFLKFTNPYLAPVTPIGYIIFILLAVGTILFLSKDIQRNQDRRVWKFQPSILLDLLSFGSFILFILLGTFFSGGQILDPASASHINPQSTKIVHLWTLIFTVAFLLHRWWKKTEITV